MLFDVQHLTVSGQCAGMSDVTQTVWCLIFLEKIKADGFCTQNQLIRQNKQIEDFLSDQLFYIMTFHQPCVPTIAVKNLTGIILFP